MPLGRSALGAGASASSEAAGRDEADADWLSGWRLAVDEDEDEERIPAPVRASELLRFMVVVPLRSAEAARNVDVDADLFIVGA
jgi:hypothetical protein